MYCYRQGLLDIWYIFTVPNKNENPRIQKTQVNLPRTLVIMAHCSILSILFGLFAPKDF